MPVRPPSVLLGLLARRAVDRRDVVDLAREVVASGCLVALGTADPALVGRIRKAGLAGSTELTVPVDRLPDAVSDTGLALAVTGPPSTVDSADLRGARIVVRADEPSAEDRCRRLAGRSVRLVHGRGRAAELAFVRCLNVLMAAVDGHLGVAVSDPRLIAIAGERAAWNGRGSDSWELVMPYGVLVSERRRLVAAGSVVRVALGDPW